MKNKILTYVVLGSMVIIVIIFISANRSELKMTRDALLKISEINDNHKALLKVFKQYELTSFKYNGKQIKDIQLTDSAGNKKILSQLIGTYKLIFNFSSTNCSECYIQILEVIAQHKGEDILIIFNTDNFRAFKFFMSNNDLAVATYAAALTGKDLPSEVEDLPCFFLVDHNLILNNVYFPIKTDAKFTSSYLGMLGVKK